MKARVLSAWTRFGFADGVPVHRMGLDSDAEPELAKSIEATENLQREDFTKEEVKAAYRQLKDAGFREPEKGRPKAGAKPIRPELALLFGKAERTISRYLAELRADDQGIPPPAAEPTVMSAQEKLKQTWPTAKLTVGHTGAWQVVIRGKTREELEAFVASVPSNSSAGGR